MLQFIERFTRTKIQRGKLPTAGEVEERRLEGAFDQIREVLERGNLSTAPVDRLLEEGYNCTDIAAALFELLTGGAPKAEEVVETKSKKHTPAEDLSPQSLRPPSRGMRWVMLSVGREERVSPRDIIGLLEDSLGLPARSVGIIEIKPGQSFAQVPQQFLDVLRDGPREIETNAAPVKVSLFDMERPEKKKRKKD